MSSHWPRHSEVQFLGTLIAIMGGGKMAASEMKAAYGRGALCGVCLGTTVTTTSLRHDNKRSPTAPEVSRSRVPAVTKESGEEEHE